jgi:hypothetical protein
VGRNSHRNRRAVADQRAVQLAEQADPARNEHLVDEVRGLEERLARAVAQADLATNELSNVDLSESFADLTLAAEDLGWRRLVAESVWEFSRAGITHIVAISRVMTVKNPLIKRGLNIRSSYVWGQGVQIAARATGRGHAGEQDVNAVIQQFLDDPANRRSFTGHQARLELEQTLGTDGNVYVALYTKPTTGRVQARTILFDQITEVISNPEDASEPWYYRRQWNEEVLDVSSGYVTSRPRHALHPAVGYRPKTRPPRMGDVPVMWDAPVAHVKVNGLRGSHFGIPDAYAACDWARAYKEFLEDWSRLCRALSRIAWKATTPGRASSRVAAAIAAPPTRDPLTREPREAGGTAVVPPTVNLEPVNKTGATLDSESGRPLAAMVAAALDVPVTMLLGDPGVTGARATAETLDTPTELGMTSRRELWGDDLLVICEYLIRESVRAPKGDLKGTLITDDWGRERVVLAGDTDTTIDIVWPPLDEVDPLEMAQAIVAANDTATIPPEVVARLLLQTLGVRHVDEIMEQLTGDNGEFLWPDGGPSHAAKAGQAAVDALRRGADPALMLGGGQQPPGAPDGGGGGGRPAVDDTETVDSTSGT